MPHNVKIHGAGNGEELVEFLEKMLELAKSEDHSVTEYELNLTTLTEGKETGVGRVVKVPTGGHILEVKLEVFKHWGCSDE